MTIFLGGWSSVLPGEPAFGGILWFLGKTAIFMYIGVWIRFTLPRLRVDQLMYTGWKVLIPMAFVTLIGASFQALLGPTGQLVMAVITWLLVAATLIWVVVKARATAHVPRALKRFAAADAVAKV